VLDDPHAIDATPQIEVYVERRPPWVAKIVGAIQLDGKYRRVEDGVGR